MSNKAQLLSLRFFILMSLGIINCELNPHSDINYGEVRSYLEKNYENLNLFDTSGLQLRLIDSLALIGNQIFFVGEYHAVSINTDIEWFFTRYFHEHAGVNYLLQEIPLSYAQYENAYLKTGNISFIDSIFSQLTGTFGWTKERYSFLKKVYSYNSTQSAERKLSFIGVDIEHQDLTALRYISSLIDTLIVPSEISDDLKKLIRLKNNGWNDSGALAKAVDLVKLSIKNYRSSYEQILGNNMQYVEIVIENMINNRIANSVALDKKRYNQIRDSCIFETFLKIFPSLPPGKFFGQWGMNHIFQKEEGCF
jgi:hypothetical protein